MRGLSDGSDSRNLIGEERPDDQLGALFNSLFGGLPRTFRVAVGVLRDELHIGLVEIEKRKLACLFHRLGDRLGIHIAGKR